MTKDPEKRRTASRKYYLKNRIKINLKNKEWKERRRVRNRQFVNTLKDNPCMDCHQKYPPCVMDYDHREDKIANIAILVAKGSTLVKLKLEIEKCDLVCANCHRIRTHITRV